MRLITRNCYALQTWHVSDYIKQAQANIIKQDTHRYVTLQNIFRKLYLRHLQDHQNLQVHLATLNNLTAMAQSPARAVTDYFFKKAKKYSELFMTATFEYLGKSYQISKSDNAGSLDTLGYKLFLSSQFTNLSEQLKFALRNNKIQYRNLITVVEALLKLQYIDYELINLLLLYTQREIDCSNPEAPLNNWSGDRQFQIQKRSYYNSDDIVMAEGLRSNPELSTAISFVRHIYKDWQARHQQSKELNSHNIAALNELINQISETNKNFRKIVEGIINIRREYVKMVDYSQNESVMRNPNLNLDLLNIEQKLLNLKLISIEDMKNIDRMKDSRLQVRRIEEILTMYLEITEVSPIFAYIDDSQVRVEEYKERTDPDPAIVSKLLHFLSKLASLDRFVYHTQDGKSLLNLKWQKTLLEPSTGPFISNHPLQEQLKVSRIFRRVYTDTLSFFERNQGKLSKIFKSASMSDKTVFLDAYCRMGLQEKAIFEASQFQQKGLGVEVSQLKKDTFSTLIHLLNEIGIFIDNDGLKSEVFEQLKLNLEKENKNKIALELRESIDIVNYLLQNHRKSPNFKNVYQEYLQILQTKATYYAPQEQDEGEDVIEAFKILALEKPDKYGSHPTYLNFILNFVNDKYKKNPYHSILRETCYKWFRKENNLRKMQPHLNLGISDGKQVALVFSNSEQNSLDGQIRSGDLNSYILRLSSKNNVLVHDLSINAFLDINYRDEKQPFKLKPVATLQKKMQQIYQYKQKLCHQKFKIQKDLLKDFLDYYPEDLLSGKIRLKLAVIEKLCNNSINLETKQQEYTNNVLFFLEILQLHKLVRLLEESKILVTMAVQNEPNAALNKPLDKKSQEEEFKPKIKVKVEEMKLILRDIKQNFFELMGTAAREIKKQFSSFINFNTEATLKGERQTLEVLQGDQKKIKKISKEFLNYRYLEDKTFFQYQDWKKLVENHYNYAEIPTDKVSNLTKIFINKFCTKTTNKINLLPVCKHSERVKKIDLEFVLLKDVKEREIKKTPTFFASQTKELQYIINLQNFKHELKTTFTPEAIVNYIFGFKFISSLRPGTRDQSKALLHRNPEEYFNYLQEMQERSYLESPYAKYIIDKLSKTDKIRHLLQKRKDMRISQKRQYQKGSISADTYFARISEVEEELVEAVKQLKTKMLDYMENNILSGQLKMMQIKKDQLDAFLAILEKNFSYNRQFDQDFIYANGDYQKALEFKRGRAQSNFLKMHLLKKMAGKENLMEIEIKQLKDWHADIIQGMRYFVVTNEYSNMIIAELPWEDLKALKLNSTSLNSNKDMLVIDLIMELNLFLNDSLIQAYERKVKAEYLETTFDIPALMFNQSSSESFKHFENLTEEALIQKHSKLEESDLNSIQQLFKILKTEGFKERKLYSSLCKDFRANIAKMSTQSIGPELIQEYIRVLQDEFMNQYDPNLVQTIKDKETDKLWREIFNDPYDYCNTNRLAAMTRKLILRLELLDGKCPPFFGNLIVKLLMHPNLDQLTKQALIAALEINKVELNIDSSNILTLSNLKGREDPTAQQVKVELTGVSKTKIIEGVYNKAKQML